MISTNIVNRSHAISTGGSDFARYFAIASDIARKTVEPISSAMPLNGRSTRPSGATRLAGLPRKIEPNGGDRVVSDMIVKLGG